MISASLRDLAGALRWPPTQRGDVLVLRAYFDESGIHAGSKLTAIAGFVGSPEAFDAAEAAWTNVLDSEGLEEFHYAPLEYRRKPFEDVDEFKRKRVKDKLAAVLFDATPALKAIGASYIGEWNPNYSIDPSLQGRFPSSYSFCFEMLMEMLNYRAEASLGGEIVWPVFAQQGQHAPRLLEMYGVFKDTGSWPFLGPVTFDTPKSRPALQMADMVLYEMYQLAVRDDPNEWRKWPFLSLMWPTQEAYERAVLFFIAHNAKTLERAMKRGPIPWGPGYRPPEEPWEN